MGQKDRVFSLQARHQEIDEAIEAENARPHPDETEIHALKKQKLRIKDEISDLSPV